MKYFFHPFAEKELLESISYYDACQEGLGLEFSREVYFAIQNILSFPKAWSSLSTHTRRCLTNRFPYGVIYQIANTEIYIIAIMQLNQKPNYWKSRKIK
ncbi:MAG: type II toxin-antitoxin system RelE/ParE family toxin [Elusimicrobiota bacterium]